VPLDVGGQAVGGVVAAGAILLQCLEDDPIEVALELQAWHAPTAVPARKAALEKLSFPLCWRCMKPEE
jgi:hypothetical protein